MAADEFEIYTRKRGMNVDLIVRVLRDGQARDLTGTTAHQLLIHNSRTVESGVADRAIGGAISGTPADGELVFPMDGVVTASNLEPQEYYAEVWYKNASDQDVVSKTIQWNQEGSLRAPT